ncbi:MAG: flagellar basal body P-ring formation protein FlgA [Phycisphaerales bacterium]|nr:flagellar basal body P-ring formation protein FlgA [Phycisphaerae bacterium]NNF43119.1 flagellar basal body P-ring formation protein FlgA [Phycisphaerales bacterium]NNM24915.1 flagellar basal body P-ring formation protein FlgA [Phycisphaerales bacterium]
MRLTSLTAAALGLLATLPASADTIRLRSSVRLDAQQTSVTLGAIARLDGAEAAALASTVIAERDPATLLEISVDDVKRRLDNAGVHWGRVNLSGRAILVRPAAAAGTAAPGAMRAVAVNPPVRRGERVSNALEVNAADLAAGNDLGGAIARQTALALGVTPGSLRLRFESRDAATLERPSHGADFELIPQTDYGSDRVGLQVRIWENGRIVDRTRVSFEPLVEAPVAFMRREVPRSGVLTADDFGTETRWLPPSQHAIAATPGAIAGRVTTQRLKAGAIVRSKHVRQRALVQRGDRVNVQCLVGGMVIRMNAEALEDGALGEPVELRRPGERSVFTATVIAPGELTLDLSTASGTAAARNPSEGRGS